MLPTKEEVERDRVFVKDRSTLESAKIALKYLDAFKACRAVLEEIADDNEGALTRLGYHFRTRLLETLRGN